MKQFLTTLAVLCMANVTSFAVHPKIAHDLKITDAGEMVDVIVEFKQQATESNHRKMRGKGGFLRATLHSIKASVYSIPAGELERLADDPDVEFISPDRKVHGMSDVTRQAVNTAAAWQLGFTGKGIGVAVIDSGVDGKDGMSPNGRVVYGENFVAGATDALDHYGHGTHVAGLIAGSGSLSGGKYKGLAPDVNIINLRVLDANASGTDSAVIAAIQRAIALKSTYNIRIINLSLGRPVVISYKLDPLCKAVESAWKAGIVVVTAAGNEGRNDSNHTSGYGTVIAPGNDPFVITVGAMKTAGTVGRTDDLIASYSSKGPTMIDHVVKPDLVAPGNRVVSVKLNMNSLMESQFPANEVTSDYFTLSGTSMAAPVVSAAAAILLQKNPSLTPDQVKARLMKTASKQFPKAVPPSTR